MKLGAVEWHVRYCWLVSGVDGLVVHCLVIGVTIELCIKRKCIVSSFVVLMSFDMREDNMAQGLMERPNDHVYNVPIGVECTVGETGLEGASGVDSFEQGVVIATELKLPRWA